MLATASPALWDRTCQEIADHLGTDTDTTRHALHRAVSAWQADPRAAATRQLDNTATVRARLEAAVPQTPQQRWAATAGRIDPRLPRQQDWGALARTMQRLHDKGHDVHTIARASAAQEPLSPARPAQDLRYRLAVIAPHDRPAPRTAPTEKRASRHEDHHHIPTTGHERPGGVPR